MKLNIARQPFVPAFVTLLTVSVVALWGAPAPAPAAEDVVTHVSDMIGSGVAMALPRELLLQFERSWPATARWLALLAALLTGVCIGRISVRTSLYGVNSCLAIPLFGMLACCLAGRGISLSLFLATFLLAYSMMQFCVSFRNGYSFDWVFRASFALGALVLVLPAALPLLLLLPFGVVLFRRTLRETVVALAGLLLLPLTVCYLNWCFRGTFVAPLVAVWNEFLGGVLASLFREGFTPWVCVACGFMGLNLCGLIAIGANFYSVGARARLIHIYIIGVFVLCLATACGPAADTSDAALTAVPSAALLPFFFVRIFKTFSTLLYFAVLAAALFVLFY